MVQRRFRLIILLIFTLFFLIPSSPSHFSSVKGSNSLYVIDINYHSNEQLVYLTTSFDVWEVDRNYQILKLMVNNKQLDNLKELNYVISIDYENTNLVNNPLRPNINQTEGIPGYPCYRTVEETYASAQDLVIANPDLAQWIDIGDSWEKTSPGGNPGYDLMILKLTNQNNLSDKAIVFFMSGLHARELAPVELNLRFAEYLIDNYGNDVDITWMLDHSEIHFLFQANPDGRKQAEAGLSWRKNTNSNYCTSDPINVGADLNRNFPFHWGEQLISNECSETYFGPAPLSEPESSAIATYILSIFSDQRGPLDSDPAPLDASGLFIDLHSYGPLILWPYGFDSISIAPNDDQLKTLAYKFAFFNQYEPMQASDLYPAAGATDDFVYGELGVASFTFEFGTSFFQNCTYFENTLFPDNLNALLYAIKAARSPYITPSGPDVLSVNISKEYLSYCEPFSLTAEINGKQYFNSDTYTQNISSSMYSIDIPPWNPLATLYPLLPTDGMFDSQLENVSALVNTCGLPGGQHILYVVGEDEDGTIGAANGLFFETEFGILLPIIRK